MKTIAITVDRSTVQLLDELADVMEEETRSSLIRMAIRELAERIRRRHREEGEAAIIHRHRERLAREAKALVTGQARK